MWTQIKGPPGLLLLSAFLAMLGAFWASVQQAADQRTFEQKLAEKDAEINKKADQLAVMSLQLAGLVTGGDSFTFVQMEFGEDRYLGHMSLWTQGKFPMFDVLIRVVDLGPKGPHGSASDIQPEQRFAVGNLTPGPTKGPRYSLPKRDEQRLNIFVQARNGMVSQELRLRWLGSHWVQASRVTSMNSGEVLGMSVARDFPQDQLIEEGWDLDRLDEFREKFAASLRPPEATTEPEATESRNPV